MSDVLERQIVWFFRSHFHKRNFELLSHKKVQFLCWEVKILNIRRLISINILSVCG